MRLLCPNCDAEYEVDDGAIPPEGRDVQCSNCANTWFQEPASKPLEDTATALKAAVAGKSSEIPRPKVNPEAMDVIHEEVERETRAREADQLETQADLGLDDADGNDLASVESDLEAEFADEELSPAPQRGDNSKRELLPDIEEINSTLASAPAPVYDDEDAALSAIEMAPRRRRGFRIGFGLMLMLTAALLASYVYAPDLAERFPQYRNQLSTYSNSVGEFRGWLDVKAQGFVETLTALINQVKAS